MELCHLIGVEVEAQHTIFPFFEREEHGWTARCIFALYIASVEKKLGKLQCSVLRTGKDAREKQTPKGVKKITLQKCQALKRKHHPKPVYLVRDGDEVIEGPTLA